MGVQAQIEVERRGYYPAGGGEVVITTQSALKTGLRALKLTERGEFTQINGLAFVSIKIPKHVAERMAQAATKRLKKGLDGKKVSINIDVVAEPVDRGMGAGCGIILWTKSNTDVILGGSDLGERGRPAEDIGNDAADELLQTIKSGACVDDYLMDQLIIYTALAVRRGMGIAKPE